MLQPKGRIGKKLEILCTCFGLNPDGLQNFSTRPRRSNTALFATGLKILGRVVNSSVPEHGFRTGTVDRKSWHVVTERSQSTLAPVLSTCLQPEPTTVASQQLHNIKQRH